MYFLKCSCSPFFLLLFLIHVFIFCQLCFCYVVDLIFICIYTCLLLVTLVVLLSYFISLLIVVNLDGFPMLLFFLLLCILQLRCVVTELVLSVVTCCCMLLRLLTLCAYCVVQCSQLNLHSPPAQP